MSDEVRDRLILEEFELRRLQMALGGQKVAAIMAELFNHQQALVKDPSRNKGALCPRRAGKTEVWPRYAVKVALEHPRSLTRIWAINRLRAKQLVWQNIKDVCERHQIKYIANETELTIKLENGSEIRLLGADKDKEA